MCGKCGARRIDAQIGLEASPDEYVAELVAVFREVRRVLRDDGTLWLNLGDSFAGGGGGNYSKGTRNTSGQNITNIRNRQEWLESAGTKAKDLMMIPARVALALQADDWVLRSQMPWIKRNSMPESVADRPSSAVEYVFMFSKSNSATYWVHRDLPGTRTQPPPDYRWIDRDNGDAETSEEPLGWRENRKRWTRINLWQGRDYFYDNEAVKRAGSSNSHGSPNINPGAKNKPVRADAGTLGRWTDADAANGRSFRNSDLFYDSLEPPHGLITDATGEPLALDVNPEAYAEAHFATFPSKLVAPMVRAGTSERGCCAACGASWVRRTEKVATGRVRERSGGGLGTDIRRAPLGLAPVAGQFQEGVSYRTVGWLPSCQCNADIVPCTVLDPFAGAFTTAMVADRMGRDGIGIELSLAYCDMARKRIEQDAGLFAEVKQQVRAEPEQPAMDDLFAGTDP